MKKVLITGGEGFVGRNVVRLLGGQGIETISFSSRQGDFGNRQDCQRMLRGVDTVIHLAWTSVPASSMGAPIDDVEQNVVGSLRLMETCIEAGVRRFVFMSSGGTVYGVPQELPIRESHPLSPISSYGITKVMVESYLMAFCRSGDLDAVILRGANAYGAGSNGQKFQGVIGAWLRRLALGEEITLYGGDVVRDYVFVEDFARAVVLATIKAGPGEIYNIGSGEGHALSEVLDRIKVVTGMVPQIKNEASRGFDVPANVLDSTLAKAQLDWETEVSLDEGIRRTWERIKSVNR
tara:strand:- start:776 stop:1654 length:879 start_codon:yes stop_codon:yes gene_type:complete